MFILWKDLNDFRTLLMLQHVKIMFVDICHVREYDYVYEHIVTFERCVCLHGIAFEQYVCMHVTACGPCIYAQVITYEKYVYTYRHIKTHEQYICAHVISCKQCVCMHVIYHVNSMFMHM